MAERSRKPARSAQPRRAAPAPAPSAKRVTVSAPHWTAVAAKIIGLLVVAALLSVLVVYLLPRPKLPGEEEPAWERTHAARLVKAFDFWGLSRDQKRARSPTSQFGGRVFLFTKEWSALLDERLMPQTKFWDFTRQENIAYLLPNTGRRPIPPPRSSPDRRPPIIVGYGLAPADLKPGRPLPLMPQKEHTGRAALDEGHTLGQTFVTIDDYDLLNAVGLIVGSEQATQGGNPAVPEGCELVLYDRPDHRRVLARVSSPMLKDEEGTSILWFSFDVAGRPPRLKYNRGSTPYLLELTWRPPPGYAGPPPAFGFAERDAYLGGEMLVDGERRPTSDLAFTVIGTHTDVEGYRRILPPKESPDEPEWPGVFLAVRGDLPLPEPHEMLSDYFKRLNESLLQP